MSANSAAMELKVLISVLQQGTALQTMLSQVNQLGAALTNLQNQVNKGGSPTGLDAVGKAGRDAAAGIKETEKAVSSINPQIDTLAAVFAKAGAGLKFLAGGFLAFQSVRFLKDIADTAARTEVLDTVLHIVARNAAVSEERIDRVRQSVQRLGITAQAARESLTKFLQAGLKPEGAEGLAKAAQDLAVISGMDSSETFRRLILNIQQLDTMGLRFQGIIVNRIEANQKYKQSHKEITGELSRQQEQEALLAEVIEKARSLQGAYEAAMGNVGKQITSLRRYYEDLRSEIGKHLLPAYSAFISELSLFLAKMQDQAQATTINISLAERLGKVVRYLSRQFFEAVEFIVEHRRALELLLAVYSTYRTVLFAEWLWKSALQFWADFSTAIIRAKDHIVSLTKATWDFVAAQKAMAAGRLIQGGVAMGGWKYPVTPGNTAPLPVPVPQSALTRLVEFIKETLRLPAILQLVRTAFGGLGTAIRVVGGLLFSTWGLVVLLVGSIVAVAGIMAKATGAAGEMGRAFGGVGKVFSQLLRLGGDVFIGMWMALGKTVEWAGRMISGLVYQIGRLGKAMENVPFMGLSLKRVKDDAKALGDWADDFAQRLDKAITKFEKLTGMGTGRLEQQIKDLVKPIGKARTERTDAETELVAAKASGQQDRIDEAQAVYDKAKDALKKLETTRDEKMEALKTIDPKRAKVMADWLKQQQALIDFQRLEQQASDIEGKMKRTSVGGVVQTREYREQIGDLEKYITYYEAVKKTTAEMIAEIKKVAPTTKEEIKKQEETIQQGEDKVENIRLNAIEKAREALPLVGPPGTLEKYRQELAKLQPKTPQERKDVDFLGREAAVKVADYIDPIYQEALARQKTYFEASQGLAREHLQAEMNLLKLRNEQQAQQDQALYDEGLMRAEDFFAARRAAAVAEYEVEVKLARQAVTKAAGEVALAKTGPERAQAQVGLQEARDQLAAARAKQPTAQVDLQERAANLSIGRQLYDMELKQYALYGTEDQVKAGINAKYDRQLQDMKLAGNLQGMALLDAERLDEIYENHVKFREQALQADLEGVRIKQEELEVTQAIINTQKSLVSAREGQGQITAHEAQRMRNELLLQQIYHDRALLRAKEQTLNAKQLDYAQQYMDLLDEISKKKGISLTDVDARAALARSPEFLDAVNKQLGQARTELNGLQLEVTNLDGTIKVSQQSFESYGKTLKEDFVNSISDALTQTIMDFSKAGEAWKSMATSISQEIVSIFVKAFTQNLFKRVGLFNFVDTFMNKLFGLGSGGRGYAGLGGASGAEDLPGLAEGGMVSGPGTGTSDSILARVSAGEHIMPAAKTARFLPLLEGIRTGKILPFAAGGVVQSIALGSVIPRRYAAGGVVVSDGGAAAVQTGGGPGSMVVTMHPDTLNMTMRDWLEHEVVRQQGRR